MVSEVANNLDKIIEACKQMQVKSLYLVGSAAREVDFTPQSDLDFTYAMLNDEFGIPLSRKSFLDVAEVLEKITGKPVDLIAEERIRNPYFLDSLLVDKIKLYEA